MSNGGDGEQPPQPGNGQPPEANEKPAIQPEKPEPAGGERAKGSEQPFGMSKLRLAGYALLIVAVLAALVPILGLAADSPGGNSDEPANAAQASPSKKAASETTAKGSGGDAKDKKGNKKSAQKDAKKKSGKDAEASETAAAAPEGPVIDAETSEQADAEQTQQKLIVGGIALGLLLIVVFGRRSRSGHRKKLAQQAKGG